MIRSFGSQKDTVCGDTGNILHKAFAELPLDLPFRYGSLTVMTTSFRSWIGSDRMTTFQVPGLEFVVSTGNIFKLECRNPVGTWFRQIIPTDTQLIHLMQKVQNQCIKINTHVLDYDYESNPLEGLITLSDKGVHLVPIYMIYDYGVYPTPKTDDLRSSVIRFEDGEFVTSLTQAIHPPVVGPMVLNAFSHASGLEVRSLFDDSAPSISSNMSEYTGEPSDLSVQHIPPAPVGNDIGKVARIRRSPLVNCFFRYSQ
jgi:hypothetical protein